LIKINCWQGLKACTAGISGEFAACWNSIYGDNSIMSATEVIERIKELPAEERAQVARFVVENGDLPVRRNFSVATAGDGLPVICANGGTITSQLGVLQRICG
jgi:hypothetical protein